MSLKINDTKFNKNFDKTEIFPERKNYLNNLQKYQYQVNEINELRNRTLDNADNNITYKSFDYDISNVNSVNQELIKDIQKGKKNMDILVQKLVKINSDGKLELTNITKQISEKITDLFGYLMNVIDQDNKEKYKLKAELIKSLKENEKLKKQVIFLTSEVMKLEDIMRISHKTSAFQSTLNNSFN